MKFLTTLGYEGNFYSARKTDLPGKSLLQNHVHQGIELYFIHEGQAHVILEQKLYKIQPNTLMFFQPFQLHNIEMNTNVNPNMNFDRSILVFDPIFLENHLKQFPGLLSFFQFLWKGAVSQQLIYLGEEHLVAHLFIELHHTLKAVSFEEKQEEVVLFLIKLLDILKKKYSDSFENEHSRLQRSSSHVEIIMEWIEKNYNVEFHLERLVDHLFLTPTYISSLFKSHTGSTIMEYLIARRLREACLLLKTTSLSIQQITNQIGLTSDSYFCQLFKKQFGITPNQYRKASLDKLYKK